MNKFRRKRTRERLEKSMVVDDADSLSAAGDRIWRALLMAIFRSLQTKNTAISAARCMGKFCAGE
ncbi:hypothetical protein [Rhizobium sp. R339]|uniref:hypothetical protein n=1 Tax=Rhizobium sp. R339 TaxID=1764273 RepID=UPI001131BA69|nr:hypothetical protein [Rhizobium sp. R339]